MKDYQQRKLITDIELAEIIRRSVQTIRNDRHKGRGLPYIKIGRSIRYNLADVERYLDSHRVTPE